MEKKILKLNGKIEQIKITSGLWGGLNTCGYVCFNGKNKGVYFNYEYSFNKEFKDFLDKFNLKPTFFNLNCLENLKGVILTDLQIKKLKQEETIKQKWNKKNLIK
jgi:hypothetical protein